MAFEILKPENETTSWVVATQRLWLTADRERLVEDGDPEAAFLFCVPGNQVSLGDAVRYGLAVPDVDGPGEKVEASDGPEKVEVDAAGELDGLSVKQLRSLAAERDVDIAGLKTKDELLTALTTAAQDETSDVDEVEVDAAGELDD